MPDSTQEKVNLQKTPMGEKNLLSLFRRQPAIIGLVVVLLILLGLGVWCFLSTKGGIFSFGTQRTQVQDDTQVSTSTESAGETPADELLVSPTPSPTPRPTGPGTYACDPGGICNEYDGPEKPEYDCPKTFADRFCLDSCEDLTVRCKK